MAIEFKDALDLVSPFDGVFAYFSAPSSVTTTLADTWYPIYGTFINDFIGNFSLDGDHILYSGAMTRKFEIDGHIVTKGDGNGITAHFGILKNGVVLPGSIMGNYMKTLNEPFQASGTSVAEFEAGDEIQLGIMSDDAGAVITVEHLTTTMRSFPR